MSQIRIDSAIATCTAATLDMLDALREQRYIDAHEAAAEARSAARRAVALLPSGEATAAQCTRLARLCRRHGLLAEAVSADVALGWAQQPDPTA